MGQKEGGPRAVGLAAQGHGHLRPGRSRPGPPETRILEPAARSAGRGQQLLPEPIEPDLFLVRRHAKSKDEVHDLDDHEGRDAQLDSDNNL